MNHWLDPSIRLSAACFGLGGMLLLQAGCSRPVPAGSLVLAQSPRKTGSESARDYLDLRYPAGSRVVLASGSLGLKRVHVLSAGLIAAGEPVMSFDGRTVVFAGKSAAGADWQIYQASLLGGKPSRLTEAPGGAIDPALLGDGSLLYISPVPGIDGRCPSARPSALYAQAPHAKPLQLTFSTASISSPTVLADGRIMFVSVQSSSGTNTLPGQALYTINNDGTEVTAFAGQHDALASVQRPRQLDDGRVVMLVSDSPVSPRTTAEFVRSANPFRSRAPLLPHSMARISSVQPLPGGDLLICSESQVSDGSSCAAHAVFRLGPSSSDLGSALFADADWDNLEAIPASASRRPMGRLTNIDPARTTGQILCLNANNSTFIPPEAQPASRATRVRVFTETLPGVRLPLGEVELQADGSFMAEVPADIPLSYDAVDDHGQVLRHQSASVWVRPGENRSCLGCHEPHNHSPRNRRPLAVQVPVPRLVGELTKLAQKEH